MLKNIKAEEGETAAASQETVVVNENSSAK